MKGPEETTVYPISNCCFLAVFISLHLSPSLCSCLSMYRQDCALRTSFRLQSTDLPGYTWQWAVKQDLRISPRHNGFVKPMLRQTDGEETTAKVAATTAEQSLGVQWYCQFTTNAKSTSQYNSLSSSIKQIAVIFCTDIHGHQRMKSSDFGNARTFPPVQPWVWITMKCGRYFHDVQRMKPNIFLDLQNFNKYHTEVKMFISASTGWIGPDILYRLSRFPDLESRCVW